jgi:hypothetical protein
MPSRLAHRQARPASTQYSSYPRYRQRLAQDAQMYAASDKRVPMSDEFSQADHERALRAGATTVAAGRTPNEKTAAGKDATLRRLRSAMSNVTAAWLPRGQ